MVDDGDWRPVIAALANGEARAVWARLVLGEGGLPGNARERRAVALLEAAGLVRRDADGAYRPDDTILRRLLAASAAARPQGVDRFLRPDGRIDRWPAGAADRAALLAHVAEASLATGETLGERELTERLTRFADDPVTLRRYLVDAGLLTRTPTGSEYTRSPLT
jgi:hypothetical protein